jgi:hypothetical protein
MVEAFNIILNNRESSARRAPGMYVTIAAGFADENVYSAVKGEDLPEMIVHQGVIDRYCTGTASRPLIGLRYSVYKDSMSGRMVRSWSLVNREEDKDNG